MATIAKQIKAAAVVLVTGLPLTGSNVFTGRSYRLQSTELPAVSVSIGDKAFERRAVGDAGFHVECGFLFAIHAAGTGDLDDTLEDIEEDILEALGADPTFGGLALESMPVDSSASTIQDENTDQPVATKLIQIRATYETTVLDV